MPLEYSDRAIIGLSEFFAAFNEKKIFVEDECGRLVHERIINEIIGKGRVHRVFALNGRDLVLNHWRQNRNDKKTIYIIDGDLDLFLGDRLMSENLFTLEKYCIENYLLSKEYLRKAAEDFIANIDDVDKFVDSIYSEVEIIEKEFLGIYVLYALSHKLKCGEKTVKDGVFRFYKDNKYSKSIMQSRKKELIRTIIGKIGLDDYRREKLEIITLVKNHGDPSSLISAKSIYFPVIHRRMTQGTSFSGKIEVLVKICSRYFSSQQAGEYGAFLLRHFPPD